jgi:predicted nucleotide-binding protein (sugar kinase/HSP70/actin superfamily)
MVPRSAVVEHYQRPTERPFTAEERASVTVLLGGLTEHHDRLLESVLRGGGFRAQRLPTPDLAAYHLGRHYGNNGQCNPAYFTVGALIKLLKELESRGLTRRQIIDGYVFLTAGACGPCRFGMYEAEYRLGLQNAGFGGFRVLLFNQGDGVKASTGEPGLKFTVHIGLGVLNALTAADIVNDLRHLIRPYEVHAGATDRTVSDAVALLAARLQNRPLLEVEHRAPGWVARQLARHPGARSAANIAWKIRDHLSGSYTRETWRACRQRLESIEVDRLRVKPVVKITGEFWAQTTEGDGNFRMFEFLEREGAEVHIDPFGTWLMYLLWFARADRTRRHELAADRPSLRQLRQRVRYETSFLRRWSLLRLSELLYSRYYHRVGRALGGLARHLPEMDELARLARPYYHPLLAGGEGHLEVAKHIYATRRRLAHMVLSLKPFGCLPSTQSDGVQSAVMNHLPGTIFLPIETGSEGAIHAYSRVQMALGEARAQARAEFDRALQSTGRPLDEIRRYIDAHDELRRPFAPIRRRPGVVGTAANVVLHVDECMSGSSRGGRA